MKLPEELEIKKERFLYDSGPWSDDGFDGFNHGFEICYELMKEREDKLVEALKNLSNDAGVSSIVRISIKQFLKELGL